jgi:hypothetical protein
MQLLANFKKHLLNLYTKFRAGDGGIGGVGGSGGGAEPGSGRGGLCNDTPVQIA